VLPGFLGTIFISFGGFGVGWFPLSAHAQDWTLVSFLQTQTLGLALSRSFVVVGAALLLQAWLVVGSDALAGTIKQLRTLHITMTAWVLPLLVTPPLFSRDVYSYYMQGRMQLDGHNPYSSGVALVPGWFLSGVDPLWGEAKTPYGPVFLLIEKCIAQFAGDSALLASYLFRAIALIGVIVLAMCVPVLARHHGISDVQAFWLGVMNPLIFMHFIAGAHNDALMVALVCLALVLAIYRHWFFATLAGTLALGIKPVGVVVLPFVALIVAGTHAHWRKRVGYGAATAIVALFTLIGMSTFVGVGPFGWLSALSTTGSVHSWLSPTTVTGMVLSTIVQAIGLGHHDVVIIATIRAIGSLVLASILIFLVVRPQGRSATRGAALGFLALVACGPVVQPWYLLWSFPLLAVTGLNQRHLRWMMLTIAAFTIHGVAYASATSDTFVEFSDGLAMVLAGATLVLAAVASTRERKLLIGGSDTQGIAPQSTQQKQQATDMVMR
jgi:hypothetical protein